MNVLRDIVQNRVNLSSKFAHIQGGILCFFAGTVSGYDFQLLAFSSTPECLFD